MLNITNTLCVLIALYCVACSPSQNQEADTDRARSSDMSAGEAQADLDMTEPDDATDEGTPSDQSVTRDMNDTAGVTSDFAPPESPEGVWSDVTQRHVDVVTLRTDGVDVDERIEDRSWVNAEVTLFAGGPSDPQMVLATREEPLWRGHGAIHIRGNSSSDYEKKQYALETRDAAGEDLDISPFGLPSEEDWVLHAPFSDKTLMRNYVMYRWARSIGRYAPRAHFVELYMRHESGNFSAEDYRGVYVLMEKIKRDKHRVSVEKFTDDDVSEVSGGYVLKRDWVEREPITTDRYGDELLFVYPKTDDVSPAQERFINEYLNSFEDALAREDGSYGEYIDVESFADHMLMMELSRNVDAYVLSTYMHKRRDGLLTMGPIWDFNGSLGNADYFEAWEIEGWHYENSEFPADNPQGFKWYEQLLKDPQFQQILADRWALHRSGAWSDETLMGAIDEVATLLAEAQGRNFERWPILGESVWPNDREAEDRSSYEEEIEYLKAWLTARLSWLDLQLTP